MAKKKRVSRARRGSGTIVERGDRWMGQISLGVDSNGKRRRVTVYGASREAVEVELARVRGAPPPRARDREQPTLQEAVAGFLASRESRLKPTSLAYYAGHLKHATAALGHVEINKLVPVLIDDLLAKHTPSTAHGIYVGLRVLANAFPALRETLVRVKRPKVAKPEIEWWTPEQVGRFLASPEAQAHRYFAVFTLALGCGLRIGEIFALRWRDLDLKTGKVVVVRAVSEVAGKFTFGPPKTAAGKRGVRLDAVSMQALKKLGVGSPDDLVFADADGGPLRRSNFDRRVRKPLMAAAGVPVIGMHGLRHTFATTAISAKASPVLVAKTLGHARVLTTLSTYAHAGTDESVAGIIDEAYGAALAAATSPSQHPQDGREVPGDRSSAIQEVRRASPSRKPRFATRR